MESEIRASLFSSCRIKLISLSESSALAIRQDKPRWSIKTRDSHVQMPRKFAVFSRLSLLPNLWIFIFVNRKHDHFARGIQLFVVDTRIPYKLAQKKAKKMMFSVHWMCFSTSGDCEQSISWLLFQVTPYHSSCLATYYSLVSSGGISTHLRLAIPRERSASHHWNQTVLWLFETESGNSNSFHGELIVSGGIRDWFKFYSE